MACSFQVCSILRANNLFQVIEAELIPKGDDLILYDVLDKVSPPYISTSLMRDRLRSAPDTRGKVAIPHHKLKERIQFQSNCVPWILLSGEGFGRLKRS